MKRYQYHVHFRERDQPPSGGCELKPSIKIWGGQNIVQPPSGGCELKHDYTTHTPAALTQPPSGGCELKLYKVKALAFVKPSRLRAAVS